MTTLLIPIETKVREFHGKLYFAYMAAKKGFDVVIGDQISMRDYADLFPRGIWIDKSVATTRTSWFRKLKAMGHRVMSWDEEGLIFFNPDLYKNLRLDAATLEMTDLFFCWGKYHEEVILSYLPDSKRKIHVCGNPRFDLMRQDLRDIYLDTVSELKKRYGKILLINTNFSFHNHFRSKDELRKMLSAYPVASDTQYIDGWMEYQKQGFLTFQEVIPKISTEFPEHTLVIRPHPSENHRAYDWICEKHANVIVNAEGNVHEWIMASDVMLHDNCTTAVEAFILGVLPISYRKVRSKQYENYLPDVLSLNVNTEEQLIDTLQSALKREQILYDTVWNDKNIKILDYYVTGLDGKTSVETMLTLMEKNSVEDQVSPEVSKRLIWKLKMYWRKYLHKYREYRNPADGYAKQKFPGMEKTEIENEFKKIDTMYNTCSTFSIQALANNIFQIKNSDEL